MGYFSVDYIGNLGMAPTERCASYTPEMLAIQRVSESLTSFAYITLFFIVMSFVVGDRQKKYWPIKFSLSSFILLCGIGHALSVFSGYYPSALWPMTISYVGTSVLSWTAVFVISYYYIVFYSTKERQNVVVSHQVRPNARARVMASISSMIFVVFFGCYTAMMAGSSDTIVLSIFSLSTFIAIAASASVYFFESQENYLLWSDLVESKRRERETSQMFASISHDVMTPLNAIVQNATLAGELIKSGKIKDLGVTVKAISDSASSQANVILKFLEIARCGSDRIRYSRFSVDEIMSEIVSMFSNQAKEKGISISKKAISGVTIYSDKTRVFRSLMNIASNAVKFTKSGTVTIYANVDKRDVTFVVEDTGSGIESKEILRIFDDFFQSSNTERDPSKGFGLGLSVSKRLIDQIGGRIEVSSAVGVGSKFFVSIPRKPVAFGSGFRYTLG